MSKKPHQDIKDHDDNGLLITIAFLYLLGILWYMQNSQTHC